MRSLGLARGTSPKPRQHVVGSAASNVRFSSLLSRGQAAEGSEQNPRGRGSLRSWFCSALSATSLWLSASFVHTRIWLPWDPALNQKPPPVGQIYRCTEPVWRGLTASRPRISGHTTTKNGLALGLLPDPENAGGTLWDTSCCRHAARQISFTFWLDLNGPGGFCRHHKTHIRISLHLGLFGPCLSVAAVAVAAF